MSSPAPHLERIPPQWGRALTADDYAALDASWITREIADAAMLRRVDAIGGRQIVGQKGKRDCAGLLIAYYWAEESHPHTYRIRRDNPEFTERDGGLKPVAKYLGAPGGANRLYIPPGVTQAQLADPKIPIVLVEGEKKALALWRLANHERDSPRFIPIAIAGVWNWLGKTGRRGGPNGGWLDVKGPIPDLARIEWKNRTTYVVFDANVHSNDSVKWARRRLARELASRTAEVKFVNLPEDCGVNGVDDLLAAWGPVRVLGLFETAVSGAKLHVIASVQYRAEADGLFRVTGPDDRLTRFQLTNFQAKALANISVDDGVETTCEVQIEANLNGHTERFTISAAAFSSMNWVIEKLGAGAIIHPNAKDYARTAIQSLSLGAVNRRLYSHTGWRKSNGKHIYLHAGGALGPEGAVTDVDLRLSGTLKNYELHPAAGAEELKSAVKASLRILDLAPAPIGFSLLATAYLAVVKQADFSVHLTGESGGFKSELAALLQQHFGSEMHRKNLPAAWSSTGNALEMMAFHAKNALLVIDDFAPQGSPNEASRLHAVAERVFRAAGNHAARGRLDSNAQLREPKPPRAMILSTGEDTPRGHSIRARLFILELKKGAIDGRHLAKCQGDASIGLYAQSMAGFVQRLAGDHDAIVVKFDAKVIDYRSQSLSGGTHARTPEIVAHLRAAFDLVLEYAEAVGAINSVDAAQLAQRCAKALLEAAEAQAKHQGETEPTARFLTLLRSAIFSGRAHLADREGGRPAQHPESCGWRCNGSDPFAPSGDRVGWIDGDNLYLDFTAAYRVAQVLGRDSGEGIPVSEQTLKKRLNDKKLLASVDESRETLSVRRTLAGTIKSVLHFLRSTILPEASDGDEDAE